MTYPDLLQQLYKRSLHGMKLGLENPIKLNAALGHPADKLCTIHIAGTNGKGSTATKIASALQAAGHKVGLYTSPHISTFRERISINGVLISEKEVTDLLKKLFTLCKNGSIQATFFEITTIMAFKYFEERQVDFAVIETGLGGRLDATNILKPCLSIITSISLDHTEILGKTIEQIAYEKGGIIKSNTPVLVGPRVPLPVIQNIADQLQAKLYQIQGSFVDFNEENKAISKAAMDLLNIPSDAQIIGLEKLPPCRLQHCKVPGLSKGAILDVAHNPDGLAHLFKALKRRYPDDQFIVVAALSSSKDLRTCLDVLRSHASKLYLTQANHPRAASIEDLHSNLPDDDYSVYSQVSQAIAQAVDEASQSRSLLVFCGTFFMMDEVRKCLGFQDPTDPLPLTDLTNSKIY